MFGQIVERSRLDPWNSVCCLLLSTRSSLTEKNKGQKQTGGGHDRENTENQTDSDGEEDVDGDCTRTPPWSVSNRHCHLRGPAVGRLHHLRGCHRLIMPGRAAGHLCTVPRLQPLPMHQIAAIWSHLQLVLSRRPCATELPKSIRLLELLSPPVAFAKSPSRACRPAPVLRFGSLVAPATE